MITKTRIDISGHALSWSSDRGMSTSLVGIFGIFTIGASWRFEIEFSGSWSTGNALSHMNGRSGSRWLAR